MVNGHAQGRSTGDIRMIPGTFIIDQKGIIRYAHYNRYAGDDPEISDLISVANLLLAVIKIQAQKV